MARKSSRDRAPAPPAPEDLSAGLPTTMVDEPAAPPPPDPIDVVEIAAPVSPPKPAEEQGPRLGRGERITGVAPDGEPLVNGYRGLRTGKVWDQGAVNDWHRRRRARGG